MLLVGLDPGVETGLAKWDSSTHKLLSVESLSIVDAMAEFEALHTIHTEEGQCCFVVVMEDARKHQVPAKFQKHKSHKYLQGIGSVKRDCGMWEQWFTRQRIPFVTRRPSSRITKWPADKFQAATGWTGRTNNHGRDAAMLVVGMNNAMAAGLWREGWAKVQP